VKVNGHTWTFNPACLRAVIGSQTQFVIKGHKSILFGIFKKVFFYKE